MKAFASLATLVLLLGACGPEAPAAPVDHNAQSAPPALVNLLSFHAQATGLSVQLTWETIWELDNAGFHLWRSLSSEGNYVRITDVLIPAVGSFADGASYSWTDNHVEPRQTYRYKLEDVQQNGASVFHGPVSVTVTE